MRFKQFIGEKKSELATLDGALKVIKRDCEKFLNESKGKLLLRGWMGGDSEILFVDHPKDRRPKDSYRSNYFNIMFNSGIEEAFGIDQIRKKSIFVSGRESQAIIYGKLHVFFPRGDFKFLSSQIISDSFERGKFFLRQISFNMGLDTSTTREGFEELQKMSFDSISSAPAETLIEVFDAARYPNGPEKFKTNFQEVLKKVFAEAYEDSTDLFEFISIGNEIMFYETYGYYIIPVKMFIDEMTIDDHNLYGDDVYAFIKNYIKDRIK